MKGRIRPPHILRTHNPIYLHDSPKYQAEMPSTLWPTSTSETCEDCMCCRTTIGPFKREGAKEGAKEGAGTQVFLAGDLKFKLGDRESAYAGGVVERCSRAQQSCQS